MMGKGKGLSKKQIPIAVLLLVVVISVITLVLVFSKGEGVGTGTEKKTSDTQTETTTQAPPELTAPVNYTTSHSIVIVGTSGMEMYGISKDNLERYANLINTFATHVSSAQVYVMLAPTSIEYYGPEKYNTGSHSQKDGIAIAYNALSDKVKSVDAWSALRMHTDEYIFFRTDHHWTARGAYYAYTEFAKTAGFTPSDISSYETGKIEGFVGSLYRYSQAEVLKNNPDYVETFKPKTQATGEIFENAQMSESKPMTIVRDAISADNKYLTFIQGDNPIIKITTENKNGKKIILIKESYGNALAPFLIDNYEEVYVTDPRRIDMDLAQFVRDNGINDVLFLNYTFAPSNKTYMTEFAKMLGQ